MSKKKNLKILLQQNFAKTPKNPLFTLEFSVILYFFYKILYFKGVRFTKIFPLKSHFRGTPQYPPFYFLVIQKTLFKGGKIQQKHPRILCNVIFFLQDWGILRGNFFEKKNLKKSLSDLDQIHIFITRNGNIGG